MGVHRAMSTTQSTAETGITLAVKRTGWIPNVRVSRFGIEDVVRSQLCMDILKSYSTAHKI